MVAAGDGLREPGQPLQGASHIGGGAAEGVGQRLQALLELGGVDSLERPGQPAQRVNDVVRRGGAGQRDRRVRVQGALPARVQAHRLRAQQALDLDGGVGLVPEPGVADPQRGPHPVTGQLDGGDPADLDPGDVHRIAGLQPGSVAELRGVGRAATDKRQLVRVVRGHGQQREDDQPGDPDRNRVARAWRYHCEHLAAGGGVVSGTTSGALVTGTVTVPSTPQR